MFRMTRTLVVVAAAVLAVAAPAASAKPITFSKPVVSSSGTSYQGTYRPVNDNVKLSPDRTDRVGTLAQVTNIHAVPVASTTTVTEGSFDWLSATIGAGVILSIVLIAAGAVGLRGRRRMALGV